MKKQTIPKIATFKVDDLVAADYNPRVISDDALAGLTKSIERFGCVEPIVVNIRGGARRIIGGHQRVKALQTLGVKECLCVTVNCSKEDEKLLNLTLNNPLIQGEFIKNISKYIDSIRTMIKTDDYMNLKICELRESMGGDEKAGNILDDEIPKPPKKAITKKGNIWQLGEHQLLCGDSTIEDDVNYLMKNNRASLFATDPPYCVNYTGTNRPVRKPKDWSNVYHEIDIPDAKIFMKKFLLAGLEYTLQKAPVYIWHADKRDIMIRQLIDELNLFVHQTIIWVKPCTVLGFAFYSFQHEPCFLIWRKGHKTNPTKSARHYNPGTVWPIGWIKKGDPTTPEYYTDIWELDWGGKKRSSGIEHPTIKPVEIFAIPIRVHTKPGDICYEPFCGSGSQIIAAEKLDRRCFAIEKEPIFCDVAVKRWEQWTGNKAKLIRSRRGR